MLSISARSILRSPSSPALLMRSALARPLTLQAPQIAAVAVAVAVAGAGAGAGPGAAARSWRHGQTAGLATSALAQQATPSDTAGYRMNHCMLRIKDPKAELDFFTRVLGMELVHEMDGGDFVNYFVAYPEQSPSTPLFSRQGLVELTWNKGTEKEDGPVYISGNEEPHRGFGHIAISVPDLAAAVAHFDAHGVQFKKRPEDGRMRNIAFAYTPTGYWVEIIQQKA